MSAKLWSEARCGFFDYAPNNLFGEHDCLNTAPGAFGSREASRIARAAGWITLGGEWCCPRCRARMEGQGMKLREIAAEAKKRAGA